MNVKTHPPCFVCGSVFDEREFVGLTVPSISLSFNCVLCHRCLDPMIMNSERVTQKLPGPEPSDVPFYDSPIKRLRANYKISYELVHPKVLLLPENSVAEKPNSERNCEHCGKPIIIKSWRDKNKRYCNRKCSAIARATTTDLSKRFGKKPKANKAASNVTTEC